MASSSILAKMALQIGANTTEMKKGLKDARQEISGFTKGLKMVGGALAGAFAIKSVFEFGAESARLADVQLKAEASLKTALKGNIEAYKELTALASAQQAKTLFADEETIKAQALAQGIMQNVDAVKKLTPIAQDFATAKGMDLTSAFELISKSVASGSNALGRYGIQIEGAAGSAERTQSAIDALTNAFGGQAEAAAKTGLGPVKQFQNAWGDVREELGKMLMPAIASVATSLSGLMPMITEGFQKGKMMIIDFINYFIDLYNESVIFRGAVELIKANFKNTWEGIKLIFRNLISNIKNAGKLLAYVFNPKNWGKGFGEGLKNIIVDSFKDTVDNVKQYGEGVADNFKTAYQNTMRKDKIPLISKESVEESVTMAQGAGVKIAAAVGEGTKTVDVFGEIQKKITEGFQIMENKAIVFGESYNLLTEKQDLLKDSIETLIEKGFDPLGNEVQYVKGLLDSLGTVEIAPNTLTFEEVQKRIADNFGLMENRALAFGEAYNIIGEKQNFLKEQINDLIDNGFDPMGAEIQSLVEQMNSLATASEEATEKIDNAMADAASSAMQSSESFRDAAKRTIKAMISEGVAAIISNTLKAWGLAGPVGLAAASLAGIGARNLFSQMVPKLAEGGLAYGPTLAVVGDNRGASADPEVIAPLSKLKGMTGDFDDSRIVSAIQNQEKVNVVVNNSGVSVRKGNNQSHYINRKIQFAF